MRPAGLRRARFQAVSGRSSYMGNVWNPWGVLPQDPEPCRNDAWLSVRAFLPALGRLQFQPPLAADRQEGIGSGFGELNRVGLDRFARP